MERRGPDHRRPSAADLHLLPSRPVPRGPGGADPPLRSAGSAPRRWPGPFLIPEAALAQRIVRAKRKIRRRVSPTGCPGPDELPDRLGAVLAVIYLIFNAGYLASLGHRAVQGRSLRRGAPAGPTGRRSSARRARTAGLAAMLQFQDGRRDARVDAEGVPLTLEEQDRSRGTRRWRAGWSCSTGPGHGPGRPYRLKASIAARTRRRPRADLTDWSTIVRLYDRLLEWEPTAVVRLNRAVAVAMADSPGRPGAGRRPGAGQPARGYHLYQATRADLLRRAGRMEEAAASYRLARPRPTTGPSTDSSTAGSASWWTGRGP